MQNLALIPKQQEFESPSSLTHKITSHPQTTFHSSKTCTQKNREKEGEFSITILLNIHRLSSDKQCEHHWTLVPGQK